MNQRLERILVQLAQRKAPDLLKPGQDAGGAEDERLRRLVRGLAEHNLLVIAGVVPDALSGDVGAVVEEWVSAYARLYALLANRLFPSFSSIDAYYADSDLPPVAVIEGPARPVVQTLAGYVLPYVARRQGEPTISEAELRGLMGIVLDELEAGSLPFADYHHLLVEGAEHLADLLALPVRQVALSGFDRPLFFPNSRPVTLPEEPVAPKDAPQPLLPDDDKPAAPPGDGGDLFKQPIPIFFGPARKSSGGKRKINKRRPPVPRLPGEKER